MNLIKLLIAGVVLALGVTGAASAAKVPTPDTLPGVKIVTVEEALGLVGEAKFFDMRKALNFGKGHVPDAVPLPYKQKSAKREDFDASKDSWDQSKLPGDKAALIVFYSDGPTGWKSYKAAAQSVRNGYTNVMWMREGMAGWRGKGQPVER